MKKVILFLLVLVICLGISACQKGPDLSSAASNAGEILTEAMNNSDAEIYIICEFDKDTNTFVAIGRMDGAKPALIEQLKRNTSNPAWLNKSTIESLQKQIPQDDANAEKYFFSLMSNEYGSRIKSCFEGADVKIIYRYTDYNGKVTEKEYS